jgi:hypothetical protein
MGREERTAPGVTRAAWQTPPAARPNKRRAFAPRRSRLTSGTFAGRSLEASRQRASQTNGRLRSWQSSRTETEFGLRPAAPNDRRRLLKGAAAVFFSFRARGNQGVGKSIENCKVKIENLKLQALPNGAFPICSFQFAICNTCNGRRFSGVNIQRSAEPDGSGRQRVCRLGHRLIRRIKQLDRAGAILPLIGQNPAGNGNLCAGDRLRLLQARKCRR